MRRTFTVDGRAWTMNLTPNLFNKNARLSLWISPERRIPQNDWRRVHDSPFCTALFRELRRRRFLRVFGPKTGGRILLFKALREFDQIAREWSGLESIDFAALAGRRIPESPPVASLFKWTSSAHVERTYRRIVRRCRDRQYQPSSMSIDLTRKMFSFGHRWTVNACIYWHRDPATVTPPSEFWSAITLWPPKAVSLAEADRLRESGFYAGVEKSLEPLGFDGTWSEFPDGRFGRFDRYRLRWKEVRPLCDAIAAWNLPRTP